MNSARHLFPYCACSHPVCFHPLECPRSPRCDLTRSRTLQPCYMCAVQAGFLGHSSQTLGMDQLPRQSDSNMYPLGAF